MRRRVGHGVIRSQFRARTQRLWWRETLFAAELALWPCESLMSVLSVDVHANCGDVVRRFRGHAVAMLGVSVPELGEATFAASGVGNDTENANGEFDEALAPVEVVVRIKILQGFPRTDNVQLCTLSKIC